MGDVDNGYMNEVEEDAAMPDYAYDYNELPSSFPSREDIEEQYY